MVEMVIESELKITNAPWNDSLSDPNSQAFVDLKDQLEDDMDAAFCGEANATNATNGNGNRTCYTEVTGFTEGSINVLFLIIRIEIAKMLPKVVDILADMQEAIVTDGIGSFDINQNTLMISELA